MAEPPNSTAVYRLLNKAMKPWATTSGFQNLKKGALWSKDLGPRGTLFFWFQCDKYGWQPYGGRFTLEFELSTTGAPRGFDMKRRARFRSLLDRPSDFDLFLAMENAIVAKLPPPGRDPLGIDDENWASNFSPATDVYGQDWLRYVDAADVERWWTEFLLPRFEQLVRRFLEGDPVDPSFVTREIPEVSLRLASRHWLLMVPAPAAPRLRDALGALDESSAKGLVLRTANDEFLVELNKDSGVTKHRSGAGLAHRAKYLLTVAGRDALVDALNGPATTEPFASPALGNVKLWLLA